MMSTKMMSGRHSTIFDKESNPSTAVMTSHPAFPNRVSAVLRMVLLSSMTITLSPLKFASMTRSLLLGRNTSGSVLCFPTADEGIPRLPADGRRRCAGHRHSLPPSFSGGSFTEIELHAKLRFLHAGPLHEIDTRLPQRWD